MKPLTLISIPILLATLVAVPCHGQVYKWVDERGVTNYSSEPPPDLKAKAKAKIVEDTLSVYTPPKAVTQAIDDARARRTDPLAEKVDNLERQLAAERRARLDAAAAPTVAAGAGGTEIINGTWYPADAYAPPRVRHRVIPQVQLKPGTTAGNVVGPGGYIPGNSAAAPPVTPAPRSRPATIVEKPR